MTTALDSIVAVLDALRIPWVLIGALAANRYRASPRMTQDVDLLIDIASSRLVELERALESANWRVIRADPEGELLRLRHDAKGLADVLVAGTDYQREAIARAHVEASKGTGPYRVLTIEDVIIHKLIASRSQDIADIEAILATQPTLDQSYLARWARFWELEDRWRSFSAAE